MDEAELVNIRLHIKQEQALGDPHFQVMAEKALGRSVATRSPGRPRKVPPPMRDEGI